MINREPTIRQMADRLENYYDFQCEGGPLKNCIEWQQLKAAAEAVAAKVEQDTREACAPYMQHKPECVNGKPRMKFYPNGVSQDGFYADCTCGLAAIRSSAGQEE